MATEHRTWEATLTGNGEYVIVDDTDYDPETICTVHVPGPHSTHTAEENAKMIEALPGLLATMERILNHANNRQASGGDKMDYQDTLRQCADFAHAAIAKTKDS